MAAQIFFDTEFSSFSASLIWSIGLVTLDGREFYAELDPKSDVGRSRLAETPWDAREIVLDKFGLFPDSVVESDWALGRRVGEWLLKVAESSDDGRVELLYDYMTDLELLVDALEECNLWPRLRVVASHRNIAEETGTIGPELASEATFGALGRRSPPLHRHHALADAFALRAAWRTWRLVHEHGTGLLQLLRAVGAEREGWLYEWLAVPADSLSGQIPLDVLDRSDGLRLVVDALSRQESM